MVDVSYELIDRSSTQMNFMLEAAIDKSKNHQREDGGYYVGVDK